MLAVIGLSYKNASLQTLAALAKNNEAAVLLIQSALTQYPGAGFVLLSTCNRVELYADIPVNCEAAAKKMLQQSFDNKQHHNIFYFKYREDAVYHLCNVAAGLDAAIIGEVQVIHQLKHAYQRSLQLHATTPLLNKLFHKAFQTGKRVRTSTAINKGNSSVVSAAIEMAAVSSNSFENKNILIVGAGKTGALLAKILSHKKASVQIWNRTTVRALQVAADTGITAVESDIEQKIVSADIVFVAIEHHQPVFDFEKLLSTSNTSKTLVDLSMPVQINYNNSIHNNHQFIDLEHIQQQQHITINKRRKATIAANKIIEEAVHDFTTIQQQPSDKSIREWKEKIDHIKQQLLQQYQQETILNDFADRFGQQLLKHIANDIRSKEKQNQETNLIASLLNNQPNYEAIH